MKTYIRLLVFFQLITLAGFGQATQKKITHNTLSWISINSNIYIDKHWFIMADVHLRENDFFSSNSFLFGRVGLGYQIDDNLSVVAGYGNLLAAPAQPGWTTRSDENRIFQQLQLSSSCKKIKILQRLRNEQRWQSIVSNDQNTGKNKFSNRVRYLLSFTVPVFKNPKLPQLVLADECMLQFGKDIVYNTFDQNRLFFGIKQKISSSLSFDAGYMSIFQQKSNGINYSQSDTYRLFFYYTLHREKEKK
ncbi:MAG: DUF2490 domain-containing protein [Chitinophagaceae bacterium]|nr:DUF2490 domain-containing protein [Chitinophagaceae bacterium]